MGIRSDDGNHRFRLVDNRLVADKPVGLNPGSAHIGIMTCLRRILSVLVVLSFALGATAQAAQMGLMASMAAAGAGSSDMSDCEGCTSSHDTNKGMEIAGCHNGICIVLPGLLPTSSGGRPVTLDTFDAEVPTVADGLALSPDLRPPRPASLT